MLFRRFVIIGLLALTPSAALALDFTQTLKDFNGKDFVDEKGQPTVIKLDFLVETALVNAPAPRDPAGNIDQAVKDKNFWLALKIRDHAENFAPSPDEIILIRKALSATQSTMLYGQAMSLVDPTFLPKDGK
jgi:hypothetical protein